MIVSHLHRFIFLKTRKTAGTSIEVALSKLAGDDAIVTPLYPPEPGHAPRNYQHRDGPYLPHMPARDVRLRLGDDAWSGYFKFCFERNPWDKIASMYWWRHRDLSDPPPFEQWLLNEPRVRSDWRIYSLDGRCVVDAVGRFEKLTADLPALLARANLIVDDLGLPHAKRTPRRHPRLYSSRAAVHVQQLFHREIRAFGYDIPRALLL